ncbi:PH domain-containing protein [Flavobacterium difficile]|uniref:PH domain-containing protein n=1 Tax=Flavobacterium difficile TaxID=2709659 RepID=A0ABX0I802_9FLAO|nr:PH domain-containing protein [Flavobacterium difficile]NHM01964.1 PH domain-containing protein [Flavobacterium difficile]
MKVYKSKIDWWLGLFLVYPIFMSIKNILEGNLYGLIGLSVVVGLILIFSKTTRYIIIENQLIVKSTWIVNERIDISKITKIEKSNSVLSSPALSLDRLSVRYNKYDEVLISPKEKKAFIDELLKANPNIEILV